MMKMMNGTLINCEGVKRMQIIKVDENKCVGCNACVRSCAVNANITKLKDGSDDQFVTVVDSNACIKCGECIKACKHGARDYVDDIDNFRRDLENGKRLTLIVAPSIRTSFPGGAWRVLLQWLRKQGKVSIYDIGFGADICTFMHNKYMNTHASAKLITQPCPAIVNYIEQYKPELIPNLSPVLSPAGCLANWLKKYKNCNDTMYMLSPCIAKTTEAEREGIFTGNVTFKRLEKYADSKGIKWDAERNFEFDEIEGGIGRLYPMPGGLKETMLMLNNNLVIRNAEGPHTVYDRLNRYATLKEMKKPDILDVLNCEFGCNYGTAVPERVADIADIEGIMDVIASESIAENRGGFLGLGKSKRFKDFEKNLDINDFLTKYKDRHVKVEKPTIQQYDEVFKTMSKLDLESRSIDCGACGYKSCKDMAYAIFCKKNVKENCVHYLKASIKSEYAELKNVYSACLEEIHMINKMIKSVKNTSTKAMDSAGGIGDKATTLGDNIGRLKKLTDACVAQYSNKDADQLTADDFKKLNKFVAAIGEMSNGYAALTSEFETSSMDIVQKINSIVEAVETLEKVTVTLSDIVNVDISSSESIAEIVQRNEDTQKRANIIKATAEKAEAIESKKIEVKEAVSKKNTPPPVVSMADKPVKKNKGNNLPPVVSMADKPVKKTEAVDTNDDSEFIMNNFEVEHDYDDDFDDDPLKTF